MLAVLAAPARGSRAARTTLALLAALLMITLLPATASAQDAPDPDPRVGLPPGPGQSAGQASWNMEKLANREKPAAVSGTNSDLAFSGDYAISGNYAGINFYDVSDPAEPTLATSLVCPGSQNDVSVHGDLLFISVQSGGYVDCGSDSSSQVLRGVRILDISDIANPKVVAAVQTCKGSHTHTLVTNPDDAENVYIYVSGTSGPRGETGPNGWPGCASQGTSSNPIFDEDHVRYSVEIIKVPVATPEEAELLGQARLFRDEETGAINGLQNGPTQPRHPCLDDEDPAFSCSPGAPASGFYSPSPNTHTCHDLTSYPALGLMAGACSGNGLLVDITDPENPVRIDAVSDVNFSYWHSATISNDGDKVLFTDEWGGGGGARCMPNHRKEWGANAIFDIVETDDGLKMEFASYYKLPAPQTAQENCVAHNGNLIPVPNRDIMVQAWYQGGTSVFDWTDASNPYEIAFFDYGPISTGTNLVSGGYWSTYWHNGFLYGNEISRGFDTFDVLASDQLSENEIAVAKSVLFDEANAQHQEPLTWDVTFTFGAAHVDQLARDGAMTVGLENKVRHALAQAEAWLEIPGKRGPALSHLDRAIHLLLWQADVIDRTGNANQGDAARLRALADTITELRDSL